LGEREDGRETRFRLLNAACEVFSQKGYRDARVADICRVAGANVASVNYHFGNKENLYREAWRHALRNLEALEIPESPSASPRDLLREYIQALVRHFAAKGELGRFSRLYLTELVRPTGLIQDAWHELIEPRRRRLHAILRAVMGPEAEELSILLCELGSINQCRALVTINRSDLEYMLGRPLSEDLTDRLARHISDFSLAGIEAAVASPD